MIFLEVEVEIDEEVFDGDEVEDVSAVVFHFTIQVSIVIFHLIPII